MMPKYDRWFEMATAPRDGTFVLLIFEGGDIACAQFTESDISYHNGWWTLDGLDFGYGWENPIGWLPRDALPSSANAPAPQGE